MNWACIIFDAMSIFLNIKQLISKAVHKEILSQILSFTHEANSFCIILLRIAFHMLVLSIQFPMPLLVPSDGLGCPGVAWGWPGTILLSGNYPGINEILSGISGPAGWGWLGLNFKIDHLIKKLIS